MNLFKLVVALLLHSVVVQAGICDYNMKTPEERLLLGDVMFREDGAYVALDEQTIHDFGVDQLLFPILNRTHTKYGAARLAFLLKHSQQNSGEIVLRQEAVKELMANVELRKSLAKQFDGLSKSTKQLEKFVGVPDSSMVFLSRFMGLIAVAGTWASISQKLYSMLPYPLFSGSGAARLGAALRGDLVPYKQLFSLAETLAPILKNSKSANLREIGEAFGSVPQGLSKSVQSVGSVKLMMLLDGIGWGSWTLPRVFKKLKKNQDRVAALFSAVAELDTYLSLADYSSQYEAKNTFPIADASNEAKIEIVDGHHPLLAAQMGDKSVPNSISLNSKNNFVIVTGSNMGGKTTFMRMVGLLPIQGRTGANVPAKLLVFSTHAPKSSMDIADSIQDGKSYFDAETDRMMEIVKTSQLPERYLVALDEAFLGTNPEERVASIQSIIEYFTRTGQLYLLSTHDLGITKLADIYPTVGNMHVDESFENGKMVFSYKVKDGPATSRNGIKVLEMKGFPKEITDRAQQILEQNEQK